jgi:CrcB protein
MEKILLIALGGGVGAILRYFTGIAATKYLGTGMPYGTLLVNISGSFLLSFFMIVFIEKFNVDPLWKFLIAVGFCGSFTTMSSITYETFALMMQGNHVKAFIHVLSNFALSFLSAYAGFVLAKKF